VRNDAADREDLLRLVRRAREGDRPALERLIAAVRDDVYGLAMRMLWHPADAEDASQEILIHDSKGVDEHLLEEEVKVGCTQGMLLCLDRDHRLAYILGEIFDLPSERAAYVLDVEPSAYRKRLSRARERIRSFMRGHCGLVNPASTCRCRRRVGRAIELARLDPERPLFAGHARRRELERPLATRCSRSGRSRTVFPVSATSPTSSPAQPTTRRFGQVVEATWKDGANRRVLRSFTELKDAIGGGEVTLKETSTVVNCPLV
jgi:hypothetical protein